VAITIFVLILSVSIVSFRSYRQTHALDSSARLLQQHIQTVRSLSLSGRAIDATEVPAGGYGLAIDLDQSTTSYRLFADRCCDASDLPTIGDGLFDATRGGGNADVENTGSPTSLATDVSVSAIRVQYDSDGPSGPAVPAVYPNVSQVYLTFVPPSATTTITFMVGGAPLTLGSGDSAQVTLLNAVSLQQKTLNISPGAVGTVQIL